MLRLIAGCLALALCACASSPPPAEPAEPPAVEAGVTTEAASPPWGAPRDKLSPDEAAIPVVVD